MIDAGPFYRDEDGLIVACHVHADAYDGLTLMSDADYIADRRSLDVNCHPEFLSCDVCTGELRDEFDAIVADDALSTVAADLDSPTL